ncbi:hypothetical protein MKZ26_03155 [Sporosarcina sp. FSL K6-6792]|uniref:hypothetical protein n=1 Tax=Sporosarcina sp. FSL K6-6792 TaxID=2921559 RepID=UPI0030F68C93
MIDIREHGGSFGNGKYKPNDVLSLIDLGVITQIESVPFVKGNQWRIDGFAWDPIANEAFICGYSTATGYNYINKIGWNPTNLNYFAVWEVQPGGTDAAAKPFGMVLPHGGEFFYSNDKSSGAFAFSKHKRSDGAYVSRLIDGTFKTLTLAVLSDDQQYIYGFQGSVLYKLDLDLNIVLKVAITHGFFNQAYILKGRYFIMRGSLGPLVIYDIETGAVVQSATSGDANGIGGTCVIRDGVLYVASGGDILSVNMNNAATILKVNQGVVMSNVYELEKGGQVAIQKIGVPYYINLTNFALTKIPWAQANNSVISSQNLMYSKSGKLTDMFWSGTQLGNQMFQIGKTTVAILLK